jgi:hypothetical protein
LRSPLEITAFAANPSYLPISSSGARLLMSVVAALRARVRGSFAVEPGSSGAVEAAA